MRRGHWPADHTSIIAETRWRLRHRALGAPGATDLDFPALAARVGLDEFAEDLAVNLGDPWLDGREARNTKHLERDVITRLTTLLGGAPDDWRGYVPSGSTEAILHGLWLARSRYPDAVVYHSAAAHNCVAKAAHLLGMPSRVVAAHRDGMMRPDALSAALDPRLPVALVVTAGTVMTEAVDDLTALHVALGDAGRGVHTHVDAAFSGLGLALDPHPPAAVALGSGLIDTWSTSGHKLLGTRRPCGISLVRRALLDPQRHRRVPYTGDVDVTIGGCRDGQAVLRLWLALTLPDHRARVRAARALAADTATRLCALGYHAWRHPHAQTVMIETPPDDALLARWQLFGHDGRVHLITPPGVTRALVDEFLDELAGAPVPAPTSLHPRPASPTAARFSTA